MRKTFFKIGILLQLILLAGHLYICRHGLPIPAIDKESRELIYLMNTYRIEYFIGRRHTLSQTIWGYDITWALYVVFIICINIGVFLWQSLHVRICKQVSLLNTILWLGCLIATLIFWSPPQQIIFGLLFVCYLLSFLFDWRVPVRDTRVCIIGAGISGLTAAYQLQKQGYTNITVLERADKVGGKCFTSDFHEKPFDLGGHEMLAGYSDLLEIADELNAPTCVSITPRVYDRKSKKYLSFMRSATISTHFTLWQVAIAALKYLLLVGIKFRTFSKPSTGYKNVPKELTVSLEKWLELRGLTPLSDILSFVVKTQGYGQFKNTPAAYLVKFMGFKNWLSLLLSGIGISKRWPRVMTCGMQNLCQRMSDTLLDVRTSVDVTCIKRDPSVSKGGVQIWWHSRPPRQSLEEEKQPMVFDRLIVATPLDLETVRYLQLTNEEKELFSQIKYFRFYVSVAHTRGLPPGVVSTFPPYNLDDAKYSGYIRDYDNVSIASFFTMVNQNNPNGIAINGKIVEDKIKEVLKTIPPCQKHQPEVCRFLEQKSWNYFPHVDETDVSGGYYNRLEGLQGHNHTYYASSLMAFECVGNCAAYAKRLVTKSF